MICQINWTNLNYMIIILKVQVRVNSGWNMCSFWLETLCQRRKLWGKLLFPVKRLCFFFSTEGRKSSFSKGNKCSSERFFSARHNVFQPKGYLFLGFRPLTYHKPLHFAEFCFINFGNLLVIRPASALEWLGIPKGQCPFGHKVTLFKYPKK